MELRIDFAFLFQNFASEGCRIDLLVPNTVVSKHPGCLAGKYESCYTKLQQNHYGLRSAPIPLSSPKQKKKNAMQTNAVSMIKSRFSILFLFRI